MKINWFAVVRYILILLLFSFFILIFKQNYLVFLLIPYLLLPMISIPLFMANVKKITYNSGSPAENTECNGTICFFIEYKNQTYLPCLKSTLYFRIYNHYYENKAENRLNFSIMPQKTDRIRIDVKTSKNGMVTFESSRLVITELLGLISLKTDGPEAVSVPVFPCEKTKAEIPEMPYSEGYEEYAEPDLKGNVSSDVKEIREYRPGDRLARIHWKVSAKLDELYVKEMERTSVMSVVILPELEKSRIDDTIRSLDMVAKGLLENGERFEVCLFNQTSCEFDYYLIDSSSSLSECYKNMYFLPLYDSEGLARDAYYASVQKSSFLMSVCGEDISIYEDGLKI